MRGCLLLMLRNLTKLGMYPAHHELENVFTVIIVAIIIKLRHKHAALMYSSSLEARG